MAGCLTEQELERLASAATPCLPVAALHPHLGECGSCRAALEEYRENLAILGGVRAALHASERSSPAEFAAEAEPPAHEGEGMPAEPLPPEDCIPGYRIVREVHRGGQGVVYEAVQLSTGRTIALKVMIEGPFASRRARWRFEREVKLIASLRHPNIVAIHDSGTAQGRSYFAMDYVEGRPLDAYVRGLRTCVRRSRRIRAATVRERDSARLNDRFLTGAALKSLLTHVLSGSGAGSTRSSGSGRPSARGGETRHTMGGSREQALCNSGGESRSHTGTARLRRRRNSTVRQVVRLFITICDAVSHAHRRGVMHRDLKPSNILVGEDGTAYVLDFGLAKLVGEERRESLGGPVSLLGRLMGTLCYMSPEQTAGDPEEIDLRTDVYSLGVILYELLTGTPPYEIDRADLGTAIRQIRETDPPRLSKIARQIDSDLEAIVLKAMEKEPGRRYQSAGELGHDLEAWLDGRPVSARSASSLYVLRKLAMRHSFETTVIAALAVIVVSFGTLQVHGLRARAWAEQQLEHSLQDFGQARWERDLALPGVLQQAREKTLAWLLLEWRAGDLDHARQVLTWLRPDSPEYRAGRFLLDEQYPADRLLAEMPAYARQWGWFVAGERALKAGRHEEAAQSFRSSLGAARAVGDSLVQSFASARLKRLEPTSPGATAGGPPVFTQNQKEGPG